jgi:hypothetical protein
MKLSDALLNLARLNMAAEAYDVATNYGRRLDPVSMAIGQQAASSVLRAQFGATDVWAILRDSRACVDAARAACPERLLMAPSGAVGSLAR